jgi:hypothetical protein
MNVLEYLEVYKTYKDLSPAPTDVKYQPKRSQKIKNKRRKGKKRK